MVRFTITIDDDIIAQIDKRAEDNQQSRAEYIRCVLSDSLHHNSTSIGDSTLKMELEKQEAINTELRARISFLESHAHQLLARIPQLPPPKISWWHRLFGDE